MENKEIAIRLVEAWGSQRGLPADFRSFINHYKEALEELEGGEK